MKVSAFLIIAGTGLLQASALRIAVVNPEGSWGTPPGSNADRVAMLQPIPTAHSMAKGGPERTSVSDLIGVPKGTGNGSHRGCSGARFRQKAIEFSNSLRQTLGMPLIKTELIHVHPNGAKEAHGEIHILPFVGTPSDLAKVGESEVPHHRHHHHHNHLTHHHGHFAHASFMRRVHFALMTLGPWEGRAVAFVLGCGIGVLLRMLWVLTVISYRAIRGSDEDEETDYIPVANQYDAEEIFVAPPMYVVDEKAPLKEAEETN